MPEEKQEIKPGKKEIKEVKIEKKESKQETLTRIMATDIPSRLSIYAGLTKIKGISWALSRAICKNMKLDKNRKISTLTEAEIDQINSYIKNLSAAQFPAWLLNRRKDVDTGQDKHLLTTELDLQREFDIRKMKKIKCYKGIRHSLGQPVRGQRTRSHFRKGRSIGVTRTKMRQPATSSEKK